MLGAKANRAAKQISPEVHALGLFAFAQQVRALQVYMVDIIATEYEAKCDAFLLARPF